MQDGTYNNVTASNTRLAESPNTHTPCVEIDFANEHGETITGTLWLTEKTLKRTVESLRHMGWRGDDLSDLSSIGAKLCQIVVESEQSGTSSNWYPRVKWVNANESTGGGGSGLAVMDEAAKKRFAAAMRGQIIAASGGVASKAAPPARASGGAPVAPRGPAVAQQRAQFDRPPNDVPEPPADLDEDIPF